MAALFFFPEFRIKIPLNIDNSTKSRYNNAVFRGKEYADEDQRI